MGLNKVIEMGRITADLELKTTQTGKSVVSFSIAVDDGKDADGNKITDFFDCEAWGKTAENICRYFGKGRMIAVVGKLKKNSWTTQDGHKRTKTYIFVEGFEFTGEKTNEATGQNTGDYAVPYGYTAPSAPQFEAVVDDDLPFD